ncbi:MAG: tRNA pseudouridine(55) synthase TruB [Pyrinomonadaceae bacterium]
MDGIFIIDKPADWTSHDVVARVRRVLRERRVGHTGTLDPFATGVLVVLVGRATRLAQFLAGAEKEYEALIRFGYATDTGDLTGARRAAPEADAKPRMGWSGAEIGAALASLRGEREQVPPMYSAKKVQGKKLYELARRGIEIERAAVHVSVHELEALERGGALLHEHEDGTCDLAVRVVCSAGTYIRVLAEEIGARLGTGAHLAALRRTRAGAFRLEEAVTLENLAEKVEADATDDLLLAPDAALPQMPFVHLTGEEARRARHGAAVRVANDDGQPSWPHGETVKLRDPEGNLLAIGVYDATRESLQPRVMLDAGEEK